MITTVVNRKTDHYDLYIGRPSKWGNPFKMTGGVTRIEAVTAYGNWLFTQRDLLEAIPDLRGLRLGCWCAPQPCHGDVLAALANDCVCRDSRCGHAGGLHLAFGRCVLCERGCWR